VIYPPVIGKYFSNYREWKKLLSISLRKYLWKNGDEVKAACISFFKYFCWVGILNSVSVKHFITHCDFGTGHIARNIALKQRHVQTWYYTDSMNCGCNVKSQNNDCSMLHPFWTYLHYDHFVTWHKLLENYFKDHPTAIHNSHIVGSLWSEHVQEERNEDSQKPSLDTNENNNRFVIAAFDSTYSKNGIACYSEGIKFAEHLIKLADDIPNIKIFLKEKKDRNLHCRLDSELGPYLIDLYTKMSIHPRITIYSHQDDVSRIISLAGLVVSFPFTSTTFEALSVNRPAIWHDPMGYYKRTPYGKIAGVTTHDYNELKGKIEEVMRLKPGEYQSPLPLDSTLMDPYRDGSAVDRFLKLLVNS
jgi:polysaccharide biosynthesis PFTS motif protein